MTSKIRERKSLTKTMTIIAMFDLAMPLVSSIVDAIIDGLINNEGLENYYVM